MKEMQKGKQHEATKRKRMQILHKLLQELTIRRLETKARKQNIIHLKSKSFFLQVSSLPSSLPPSLL